MNLLRPEAAEVDVAAALEHYREHGWARIGRVLTEEGAEALARRVNELMLGEVVYDGLFFQKDSPTGSYDDLQFNKGWQGPSLEYRKVEKLERDPLYRAWIENALFERIARAWIGDSVSLYRAVVFNKAESGGTNLPFHQDGGRFWGIDREPTLQVWTALDDVPIESGCVEVVPGTHKDGLVTVYGGNVAEDTWRAADADERAQPLPARAGEVLLIHNHVWHRSRPNRSGRQRRAVTVCYLDGATRCTRKKRAPREFLRLFERPGSPS